MRIVRTTTYTHSTQLWPRPFDTRESDSDQTLQTALKFRGSKEKNENNKRRNARTTRKIVTFSMAAESNSTPRNDGKVSLQRNCGAASST